MDGIAHFIQLRANANVNESSNGLKLDMKPVHKWVQMEERLEIEKWIMSNKIV